MRLDINTIIYELKQNHMKTTLKLLFLIVCISFLGINTANAKFVEVDLSNQIQVNQSTKIE